MQHLISYIDLPVYFCDVSEVGVGSEVVRHVDFGLLGGCSMLTEWLFLYISWILSK